MLIGNEPFGECMRRIEDVIRRGGEPHVQPMIKLAALEKLPVVRHDWTLTKLREVSRWANRWVWRTVPFRDYAYRGAARRLAPTAETLPLPWGAGGR